MTMLKKFFLLLGGMVTDQKIISYEEFISLTKNLANQIKSFMRQEFAFDALVPIARGGLVPATYLSHMLNLPIIFEKDENFNKTHLFIDDIVDKGDTLKLATVFMGFNKANDRFACLIKKPWTTEDADFFVSVYKKWVIWPWENV